MKHYDVDYRNDRFGDASVGMAGRSSIGHSSLNWFVRSREAVKNAFRFAFDVSPDTKMISSFDGINVFRNPEVDKAYQGSLEPWFHLDAGKWSDGDCIQGLVNLIDCTDDNDAGLVVFPKSNNTIFKKIVKEDPTNYSRMTYIGPYESKMISKLGVTETPHRVPLRAGSLAMWRSSTIHCSTACLPRAKPDPAQSLRRLVVYTCMCPDPRNAELTEARLGAFHRGNTTCHEPHRVCASSGSAATHAVAAGVVIIEEARLPEGAAELL